MVDDVSLQIPVNVMLDIQEQIAKRVSKTCIESIKHPYCLLSSIQNQYIAYPQYHFLYSNMLPTVSKWR